ncbi:MAG: hypothetical protein JXQ96_02965 [Cyclobacteriaceae bacterium]
MGIRIPLFYSGIPMIIPELKWMLIGESLASGNLMYRDVWDFTGPLAAGTYAMIHLVFGKSLLAMRSISIVLVLIQSSIFNSLLLRNKALNSNTYVPALLYVLFMHISFDFMSLSPVLMGMTFVLLAIDHLFQRMDNMTKDNLFVRMGLFLGLATLLYLPFVLYFLVIIVSLLVYTGSIFRRMFLMIYGFLLVLLSASLYYYWSDSLSIFRLQYFDSIFTLKAFNYFSTLEYIGLVAVPLLVFIISLIKTKTLGRYVNFQIKIQSVMLMFMVFGVLSILMTKELAIYQMIFFVPGMAFFCAHYLLALRNWIVSEAIFGIIAMLILLNMLFPLKRWLFFDEIVSYDSLVVKNAPYNGITEGRSLLIIGDDISLYKNSALATPYLNWQFSKAHLQNLSYYDNLTEVFANFHQNSPEVIIDQKNIVPDLFRKMPTIALRYKKHNSFEHVYLMK